MSQALTVEEEYCPNCGGWFDPTHFNFDTGWCRECSSRIERQPRCKCGVVLTDATRSTCPTCRQEQWYEVHADELEYVMLVKGYSLYQAKLYIARITRPICQCCHKPIKGARAGRLFCKQNKKCHSMYGKYRRLRKRGLSDIAALDKLHSM